MERRLAAILAADLAGYSRLMSEDEAGTLDRLEGLRTDVLDPTIARHSGRVVKVMGDGFLVEFASIVDALGCALAWQEAVENRAEQVPADRAFRFRIGVNLGDVLVKGDDVYGDGVNLAARLEEFAEPGSVLVSRTVFDHTKGKVGAAFEDLGEQQLKNIAEPVRIYKVLPGVEGTKLAAAQPAVARTRWRRPAAMALAATLVFVAGVGWIAVWRLGSEVAAPNRLAFPLPDKPSIAVLPFRNASDDPDQAYFVDGMTEDLITDLSKIPNLFVIARNSSFSYRGRRVTVRQVAEDLGIRYVLEGSVRRSGEKIRINAQLVDATTGGQVWAEHYDGRMVDVFALQDRIREKILTALAITLAASDEPAPQSETTSTQAYDAFLQGWEHLQRDTAAEFAKALPYLEKAVDSDPRYGRAYAALAWLYYHANQRSWHRSLGVSQYKALELAYRFREKAMALPTALAHRVAADMLWRMENKFDEAVDAAERAVALDPNDSISHAGLARALIHGGRPRDAIASMKKAIRLDPHYPPYFLFILGFAEFMAGDFEDAARELDRALERNPEYVFPSIPQAAAYAYLGREQEAHAARDRFLSVFPGGTISGFSRYWPFKLEEDERLFLEGVRKAGFRP